MWEEEEHCARAGLSQIYQYSQDSFALQMLLPRLKEKEEAKGSCFLRNCPVAGFGVCVTKMPLPPSRVARLLSQQLPSAEPRSLDVW